MSDDHREDLHAARQDPFDGGPLEVRVGYAHCKLCNDTKYVQKPGEADGVLGFCPNCHPRSAAGPSLLFPADVDTVTLTIRRADLEALEHALYARRCMVFEDKKRCVERGVSGHHDASIAAIDRIRAAVQKSRS